MALFNEGIHSNYYVYKLIIKYFIIYSFHKELYHHYFMYKYLGSGLKVHDRARQAFATQYPIHSQLIDHLTRVRHLTWNYVAPATISASLCFNWVRYSREKLNFPLRILKTVHYSALTTSLACLAPFYYTYVFHSNRNICFQTTQNYYRFMMERADRNWETYVDQNSYFKLRPKPGWRDEDHHL